MDRFCQIAMSATVTATITGPSTIPDTPKTASPPMKARSAGTGCSRIRPPAR